MTRRQSTSALSFLRFTHAHIYVVSLDIRPSTGTPRNSQALLYTPTTNETNTSRTAIPSLNPPTSSPSSRHPLLQYLLILSPPLFSPPRSPPHACPHNSYIPSVCNLQHIKSWNPRLETNIALPALLPSSTPSSAASTSSPTSAHPQRLFPLLTTVYADYSHC